MSKITWPNRTDIKTAIGVTTEWAAAIANEVKTSVNALYDEKLDKISVSDQTVASNVEGQKQISAIGGFGKSAAFAEAIKADAQYYFPDHTQTGVLNFTKDASVVDNEGYGNGSQGVIIANGDAWRFSDDFNIIRDELIASKSYQFVSWWNGLKMNVVWKKIDSAFTPLDLGVKLLNWWDGTIVDESPAGKANSWQDQKSTAHLTIYNVNKPSYASDLITFDSTNEEALQADVPFDRSAGEYWFVIDHILNITQEPFGISDSLTKYFRFLIIDNVLKIQGSEGGGLIASTTEMSAGKNIIRIKNNGLAWTYFLNNVDISSEFSGANDFWESEVPSPDSAFIGVLDRTAVSYTNAYMHSILRCDETLTTEEASDTYDYLNAKY